MAELTTKQFAAKLKGITRKMKTDNLPYKIAVQTVHALRINRIFHVGLNASAGRIGSYDTKREIYASDDQLRRKGTHKGKSGKTKFQSGKAHKTSYYKNYKALKQQQGFNASRVNLRMTNNLQSEFANVNISKSSNSAPKGSMPVKVNPLLYVERIDNLNKLEGIEKKYGDVFGFTNGERTKFNRTFQFEMNKLLNA
jgi:hypothetical protein